MNSKIEALQRQFRNDVNRELEKYKKEYLYVNFDVFEFYENLQKDNEFIEFTLPDGVINTTEIMNDNQKWKEYLLTYNRENICTVILNNILSNKEIIDKMKLNIKDIIETYNETNVIKHNEFQDYVNFISKSIIILNGFLIYYLLINPWNKNNYFKELFYTIKDQKNPNIVLNYKSD